MAPTYLVCSAIGYFADDVKAVCACGAAIVHRPHASPDTVKVCLACAEKLMRGDDASQVKVTNETLREAALYRARTKGVQ